MPLAGNVSNGYPLSPGTRFLLKIASWVKRDVLRPWSCFLQEFTLDFIGSFFIALVDPGIFVISVKGREALTFDRFTVGPSECWQAVSFYLQEFGGLKDSDVKFATQNNRN